MLTIEDIAKKAGVSHSTVSRALSGSPLVNAATRERVLRVAQDSGYQVNTVARSLATRTTHSLGLVVPEVKNPYYPELIQHVIDRARDAGYSVLLNVSGDASAGEAECLRTLRERRADGILLVAGAGGLNAPDEVRALRGQGVPVVLIGWDEGDAARHIDTVAGDDAAGGYELGRHLIALGHRRIVCLAADFQPGVGWRGRIDGLRRALAEAGLPTENLVRVGFSPRPEEEAALRAALAALLAGPDAPTALCAHNDILAVRVLACLAEMRVAVPGAVSVAGFDNLEMAGLFRPRLTSVDYPTWRFAEEAVTLLLDRLSRRPRRDGPEPGGEDDTPCRVLLTPKLIVRESTGASPLTTQ